MRTALSSNSKTGCSINWNHHTCKADCPFFKGGCYGDKGPTSWSNTRKANHARYRLYATNPAAYFTRLEAEIRRTKKPLEYVRVNGDGDTPDAQWVARFLNMAERLQSTKFWVATRYKEWWSMHKLPDNVVVRYSIGIDGEHTSTVTTNEEEATCPATIKGSGIHTCKECGYLCWDKAVKQVVYNKH